MYQAYKGYFRNGRVVSSIIAQSSQTTQANLGALRD